MTADQRLLDVGLLALVALETGGADLIAQARQALDRFAADGKDVPPSLLDVTGAVHPLGGVVNGFDLAVWGLGVRALNADDKSARRALGLLESVGWSENFTKTGDVLATERRLATAAALHDLLEDAVAGRLPDRCAKALTALAPSGDRATEAAAKLIAQVAP